MNPSTPRRTNSTCSNDSRSHNRTFKNTPTNGSMIAADSSMDHNSPNHHHNMNVTISSTTTRTTMIRFLVLCILIINSMLFSLYGSGTILTAFIAVLTDDTNLDSNMTDRKSEVMDQIITSDVSDTKRIRRRVSTESIVLSPLLQPQLHKKKSILVTGAAGFVGSHVVEYLLLMQQSQYIKGDDGDFLYDIVVIDEVNDYYDTSIKESNLELLTNLSLSPSSLSSQTPIGLHIYRGDICNTTLLDQIFTQHNIVLICHMAARAGVRPSIENPYVYIHSNIIGTLTLLQYAVQYQIQNFVFASSSSVYGGSTSTYFTETEAVDHPISPYAATKKSCELFSYIYAYQHQLNVTALRFFTVYGPRGRPDMAPYKFIHAISNQIPIQQYGDGSSSRDYTYISDIVSGVVKSLIDHPSRYSIYNLGKGNGTTLNDFVHYVETYVNASATIQVLPDQPGDVPYTCANITKAQMELEYLPSVPFPNGIQKTVQWYQQRQTQLKILSSASSSNKKRNVSVRRQLSREEIPIMELIEFDDEMMDPISTESISRQHQKSKQRRKLQQKHSTIPYMHVVTPMVGYKKVAVSGAISSNPFVGQHVVEALLLRGDDVVLIDDNEFIPNLASSSHAALFNLRRKYLDAVPTADSDSQPQGKLYVHIGNRNNSTFLEQVFQLEQPTHVCHFGLDKYAMSSSILHEDDLESSKIYVQKNVEILTRLFEVSRGGGKTTTIVDRKVEGELILNHKIQNFVFTSSDAVYGYEAASTKKDGYSKSTIPSNFDQYILWNETNRVDYPKSSYGASMKSAELLGYTYHHLYDIPMSVLRLFNIYGPRQTTGPSCQLFDMLVQAKGNDAPSISDHNPWDLTFDFRNMDYSSVDDIVQGILSSIDRPYGYEIFNLGSGKENCVDGIANLVRSVSVELSLSAEKTKKILKGLHDLLPLHTEHVLDGIACANIQKASALLDYIPNKSTLLQSSSLQRTIKWYRQQDSTALASESSTPTELNFVRANLPTEQTNFYDSIQVRGESKQQNPSNAYSKTLCPKEVIVLLTNNPNYSQWLSQLALAQWMIVILILVFRFFCRLRSGSNINGAMSTPISTDQQQEQQQLLSRNNYLASHEKEGRISPRRERL